MLLQCLVWSRESFVRQRRVRASSSTFMLYMGGGQESISMDQPS